MPGGIFPPTGPTPAPRLTNFIRFLTGGVSSAICKLAKSEENEDSAISNLVFILLTAWKPSALALGGNAAPLLKYLAKVCIAHDMTYVEMTLKAHRGILLRPLQYLA
jgi:hypothetical protein